MTYDVAVLVGSLRKDGLTLRLAQALATLAGKQMAFHIVPIGNLPLYDPKPGQIFRRRSSKPAPCCL